jgi:hypothetical protein
MSPVSSGTKPMFSSSLLLLDWAVAVGRFGYFGSSIDQCQMATTSGTAHTTNGQGGYWVRHIGGYDGQCRYGLILTTMSNRVNRMPHNAVGMTGWMDGDTGKPAM